MTTLFSHTVADLWFRVCQFERRYYIRCDPDATNVIVLWVTGANPDTCLRSLDRWLDNVERMVR